MSQACVSKYLNNKPYVSKKTKEKIKKAIEKLNYRPSAIARSLVSKKTNKIGVLVWDITNPYQTKIIRKIEEYKTLHNLHYDILLIDMKNKEGVGDKYINTMLENRVVGIVTTSDKISIDRIKFLKEIKLPIIFIGRRINVPDIDLDYVMVDNMKGAYSITKYLLNLGHRKIIHLTGPLNTSVSYDRLKGYEKAMKEFGIKDIKENLINLGDFTFESGTNAAKNIFSAKVWPTAIFCANDFSAFGVMDYCYKHDIKIPEDVSIAGFDDINFSSLSFINLTTVKQPIKKICETAAKALFEKIKTGDDKLVQIILEPELKIRKSTRAL